MTVIYKRDDFNFEIVNFPFLDGDVPRSPSYGVHILQHISFMRVYVLMLMTPTTEFLTATCKFLKQGY